VAFNDIAPRAPVHILIIPRKHVASVSEIAESDCALIGAIFQVAVKLAREHGIAESGYRVVVNSGADAGQSVFHIPLSPVGRAAVGLAAGMRKVRVSSFRLGVTVVRCLTAPVQ
jgi:histidine triad (HIT) family protein